MGLVQGFREAGRKAGQIGAFVPHGIESWWFVQGLREAGMKAGQMTGAGGPTAAAATGNNLGQMGADTIKEFEVRMLRAPDC